MVVIFEALCASLGRNVDEIGPSISFVSFVILWKCKAVGQADAITLFGMARTLTAIVRIRHSALSVMRAVINYAGTFEL